VSARTPTPEATMRQAAKDMHDRAANPKDIAAAFGVDVATLYRWHKKYYGSFPKFIPPSPQKAAPEPPTVIWGVAEFSIEEVRQMKKQYDWTPRLGKNRRYPW
jgi:transposase-like protein